MKAIQHLIRAGERWDSLAHRYYGNVAEMSRLIQANPQLAICEVLPQGEFLLVPIIEQQNLSNDDVPPWRVNDVNT